MDMMLQNVLMTVRQQKQANLQKTVHLRGDFSNAVSGKTNFTTCPRFPHLIIEKKFLL
jgi:hypothetical protein